MLNHPFALEISYIAVEEAIRLGASFADARYEARQHEDVITKNGVLNQATIQTERGVGVRVLVRGAWGFAAISEPSRHDVVIAARRAVDLARAAAILQERPVRLVDQEPHRSIYRTQIKRDPLAVPLEDKVALLLQIDEKLRRDVLIKLAIGSFAAERQRKIYVNSEGSEIDQELVWTGIGYQAGASDGTDFQVCSFPSGDRGQFMGQGWELIGDLPLIESAEEVAAEAIALLKADPCPSTTTDLILGGPQVARQVHESCGQLVELDRVIGLARSSSNGSLSSFLTPDKLGVFEYGSKAVNLYADATEANGAGSFGFDDEGVEAQRVDLVTQGRFTGYLSGRETAREVGLERSQGAMRAASWANYPVVRMTNVSLEPGDAGDLDALIADTKSGIFMDRARGFSLDGHGSSFQASCEVAWEIKNGKKVRRLKNPTYSADTQDFWKSCDAICSESEWSLHGIGRYGKGHPTQLITVGHGVAPTRFTNVEVGVQNAEPPVVVPDGGSISFVGGGPVQTEQRKPKRKRGRMRRSSKRKSRKRDTK